MAKSWKIAHFKQPRKFKKTMSPNL